MNATWVSSHKRELVQLMVLMPCSEANSARALQCPQPTPQRPGSLSLSQPPLGNGCLPWDLLSCMSSSWPPVTHHSTFGFWLVLKGCPRQAEQTQSLWFSLFLSSSPVKCESGKEISLCKLLVHNHCWILYLYPSACHHTAATTLYLSSSFPFFPSPWAFLPLHSLPCCRFLLLFFSPLWSLLSSVLLFSCLYICSPPVFAQACGKNSLSLVPLEAPRGIPGLCRGEVSHGTKTNFCDQSTLKNLKGLFRKQNSSIAAHLGSGGRCWAQ